MDAVTKIRLITDLRRAARGPGSVVLELPHGTLAYYDRTRPTRVFSADPGSHEEVEAYYPCVTVAKGLVEAEP